MILRVIGVLLIAIGLAGLFTVQSKMLDTEKAIVVVKWCQIDVLQHRADSPACNAVKLSSVPDKILPMVTFYNEHEHYLRQ
jgi:hypothetical protein